MKRFTTSIEIAAPPEQVWPVMRDVERWHEWTPTIISVTRQDAGPLRAGSRAVVRQPKLPLGTYVVTSVDEGRAFTWENRAAGVLGVAHHRIEPTGSGSRVSLDVEFHGPLAWLVSAFYGRLTQRYIETEAAGLKRRVEVESR